MIRLRPLSLGRLERLVGAVIALRFLVAIAIYCASLMVGREGLNPLYAGDDGDVYWQVANQLARGSASASLPNVWPNLLAWLIGVTGIDNILFYRLLNEVATAGLVLVAILLTRELTGGDDRAFRRRNGALALAAILVGLYPTAVASGSLSLYRDNFIYLLHLTSVYLAVLMLGGRHRPAVVVGAGILFPLILYALFLFRWYAAVAVVFAIAISFVAKTLSNLRRGELSWRTILPLGGALILAGLFVLRFIASAGSVELLFNALLEFRSSNANPQAGSNIGFDLASSPPLLKPLAYFYSLVSNAVGPLPWQVKSAVTALTFLIEVPLLLLCAFGLIRLRRVLTPLMRFVFLQGVVWIAIISIFNDNLGTATRLRVLGWNCFFVVLSAALYQQQRRRVPTSQTPLELP